VVNILTKEKYSIMIVDDELPIKQELAAIDWGKYGCEFIGEASNGRDALEKCKENTPNIILTDITMPLMNGLEMIKKLKIFYPSVKVIILTCHMDFKFVKEAITIGALDYILKVAMDESELEKPLKKAIDMIERERIVVKEEKKARKMMLSKIYTKIQSYNQIDRNYFCYELEKMNISIKFPTRNVVLYIKSKMDAGFFIDELLQDFLSREGIVKDSIYIGDNTHLLFISKDSENIVETSRILEEIITELNHIISLDNVLTNLGLHVYGIIGDLIEKEEDFYINISDYVGCKANMFYNPKQLIVIKNNKKPNEINKYIKESFSKTFNDPKKNKSEVSDIVKMYFKKWAIQNWIQPKELKSIVLSWLGNMEQYDEKDIETNKMLHARNIDEMECFILNDLTYIIDRGSGYRPDIKRAIDIIKEKYGSSISLTSVSAEININPQYLSKLFHSETKELFNDYVTKIRIENAVKLLKESDLKIFEIAEKVGIPNYRYFSTVFKYCMGISPKNYKRGY
jgi:two-component system response regulator YesN